MDRKGIAKCPSYYKVNLLKQVLICCERIRSRLVLTWAQSDESSEDYDLQKFGGL